MMELFQTRLNLADRPMSRDELAAAMREADVLVPTVTDRIDAALIEQAGPRLRLIASFGTGVDHIDLRAAKTRHVTVTNTPGVQIGRASCRASVCQYVSISVVDVSLKKKTTQLDTHEPNNNKYKQS